MRVFPTCCYFNLGFNMHDFNFNLSFFKIPNLCTYLFYLIRKQMSRTIYFFWSLLYNVYKYTRKDKSNESKL